LVFIHFCDSCPFILAFLLLHFLWNFPVLSLCHIFLLINPLILIIPFPSNLLLNSQVGSVSSSALLLVDFVPPRFHANIFPSRVFIVEGGRLALPCLFQSSPPGKAEWHRLIEGGAKQPVAHVDVDRSVPGEEVALLRLENAQALDTGDYECVARSGANNNAMANANASARVRVEVIRQFHLILHIRLEISIQLTCNFSQLII
jgi:hypothetical protein